MRASWLALRTTFGLYLYQIHYWAAWLHIKQQT